MEWLCFASAEFPNLLNLFLHGFAGQVVMDAQCQLSLHGWNLDKNHLRRR